jgi:hypothetical protein
MASTTQCDQCRKLLTAAGGHRPGWLDVAVHGMTPGERGPVGGAYCANDEECPTLDFCSWRCLHEYVTVRILVESPPQLPGTEV